jgi:branched-chain amino acid transport system permease protein
MNYIFHILVMVSIYSILALSLNLLVGYTGLLSLSHAAFYGVGAYTWTLLVMKAGWGFAPALISAIAMAVLLSFVISIPSLRLKGDYFVIASMGFQIIAFYILYNWVGLTRGPYGIPGVPRPVVFGWEVNSIIEYFFFSAIVAVLCGFILHLVSESPYGRVLKAIREDEVVALALGKNVTRFKISAFAIAAGFAAVPGVLFAGYMRYIDPTSFTLLEAIFILSIVVVGGAGNIIGPVIGAVFMVVLPEALRFMEIPDGIAANMRQMIYGAILILLMRYRPQGFRGEYRFE